MVDFASIYGIANRPTTALQTPMEAMGQALQLKSAMQQGELQGLNLKQQQQAMADAEAFKQDVAAAGGDPEKLKTAMMKRGKVKEVADITKSQKDAEKAQLDAVRAHHQATTDLNGQQLMTLQAARDAIAAAPDQAQAIWDRTRLQLQKNAEPFAGPLKLDLTKTDDPTMFPGLQFLDQKIAMNKSFEQRLKEADLNKPLTEIGKLNAELKAGRITEAQHEAGMKKATTHAPGAQVYTGTLVPGIDPTTGKPAFAMPSKDGTVKIVPGFEPTPKDKSKGKVDVEKLDAVLGEAEALIDKAPGSYAGAGLNLGKRLVGISDETTQAAQALKGLEAQLMMAMPRMEGPQSDKDVALYRQQAGQIGDPSVPAGDKKAAIRVIKSLTAKYREAVGDSPAPARPKPAQAPDPKLPFRGKTATLADLQETARANGMTVQAAKAKWISGGGKVEG